MVAFVAEVFARRGIDASLRPTVDFAVEELFTNMVKYAPSGAAELELSVAAIPGGVEATLIDRGVDRFDPTLAPEVDVTRPIGERRPGGLGLHLVRKMVDALVYEYREDLRQARITFRKTSAGPAGTASRAETGDFDARD
jgi:serine/threonine-protein kinase RsbW